MMTSRFWTAFIGSIVVCGGASVSAKAQNVNGVGLPVGYANPYAYVSVGNTGLQGVRCNPYVEGTSSATSSSTCVFDGLMPDGAGNYYDVGHFTTTQSASMVQGQSLHASTRLTGYVEANRHVTFDAVTVFNDALTITGPYTPATVVFHAMIEGSASNPDVAGSFDTETGQFVVSPGRFDFSLWNVQNGQIAGGTTPWSVPHDGTSGPRNTSWSVSWPGNAFDNTLYYQMSLVAFGRFSTLDVGQTVDIYSDYSNTASFNGVSVYDAAGNDITSAMTLRYASAPLEPTTAPEPASLVLVGSGLLALGGWRRRARRLGTSRPPMD